MTFSDLQTETTNRLAAQRQIDAAVNHLHKSELESAITLATAAEGLCQRRRADRYLHICVSTR
jgi:hypothetical protein